MLCLVGNWGPSLAPIFSSCPKPLLGPHNSRITIICPLDLVIPDLPYYCLFLDSLSHRCAISLHPLSLSPFPGEKGWAPPLPLHAPINSTVDSPGGLGDGEEGGGRLQERCVGAKIAAESPLLSLADCALAAHFPFTSPLRAAGVWQMNQLLRL